jgi:hypothetical protein
VFDNGMKKIKRPTSWLTKKARRGFRGYPIATVAFYGPTADLATKIAVTVVPDERNQPDLIERWFSEGSDIRHDSVIGDEVSGFLRKHEVRSVVVADRIIGCPHEEGIDYPDGQSCPQCPYWAGRDRFTHERVQ